MSGVRSFVHGGALRVFGRLPVPVQERVIATLTPGWTLGALAVVRRPDGRVLLLEHSYRRAAGLPGGLLKRGETPREGCARELREEVGLSLDVPGDPALAVTPGRRQLSFSWLIDVDDATAAAAAPRSAEVLGLVWAPLDALPELQPGARLAVDALRLDLRPTAP